MRAMCQSYVSYPAFSLLVLCKTFLRKRSVNATDVTYPSSHFFSSSYFHKKRYKLNVFKYALYKYTITIFSLSQKANLEQNNQYKFFFAFAFTLGFSLCYFACLRLFHLCLCYRFQRDLNHLQNLSQEVAKNLKKLEHSQFARFLEKRETVVLTFVFFRLDNV